MVAVMPTAQTQPLIVAVSGWVKHSRNTIAICSFPRSFAVS